MSFQPNDKVKAKILDHFITHLQNRTDVQNIDLMNLANFCRNCLAKWAVAESEKFGDNISIYDAKNWIYGMDYDKWKDKFQKEATTEQLEKFNNRQQ